MQRLPLGELVRCSVTGQLVSSALAVRCPASGQTLREDRLVTCPFCRQAVSPLAVDRTRCSGCRQLTGIPRDDQRIQRVLRRHPRLSGWQWLCLAETGKVYVVTASGFVQRRLLVLDKEDLTVRHAARGHRFSRKWTDVQSGEGSDFY